jgi:hypothetical protein
MEPEELQENEAAEAGSDVRFERQDATSVTNVFSTVTAYHDIDLARRRLDAYDDQAYFDCKAEDLEAQVAADPTISDVTVEAVEPAAGGDAAVALRVVLVSDAGSASIQLHEVLVGEVGLSVMVLASAAVEEDAVRGLVDDAFDAMLGRLEAAQG